MAGAGLEQRYLAACAIAREAGDLLRRRFADRAGIEFTFKGPQDYCAAADSESEQLIRARIGAAFPEDSILGEEEGGGAGERTWVVDPIDGTANFVRGVPHFCTSIAYVEHGRVQVGVIYQPTTDELFAAFRGRGATLNGRPMRVSRQASMRDADIEIGWSPRRAMTDYLDLVRRVVDTGAGFRRAASGALAIAYVADGRIDGYCELHINSWDCLAALLMVEEAGGWTNDFLAADGMHKGNPVLACGPNVRDALIAATGIGA